jgi:hypothetical protein
MEKFYYYAKNGGIRVWERHDKHEEDRPLHDGETPDGFVGTFTPDDIRKIEKEFSNAGPCFYRPGSMKTYQSILRIPVLGWHVCRPFCIAIPTS